MGYTLPTPAASPTWRGRARSWYAAALLLSLTGAALVAGDATTSRAGQPGLVSSGPSTAAAGWKATPAIQAYLAAVAPPFTPATPPSTPRHEPSARLARPSLARVATTSTSGAVHGLPGRLGGRSPAAASAATAPAARPPVAAAAPRGAAAPAPSPAVAVSPPASPCEAAITTVEGRGLFPAAGFVVVCPGFALGHEGMTCMNVAGVCPGARQIVIHDPQPFVVANEFENSRILSGSPVRCGRD